MFEQEETEVTEANAGSEALRQLPYLLFKPSSGGHIGTQNHRYLNRRKTEVTEVVLGWRHRGQRRFRDSPLAPLPPV